MGNILPLLLAAALGLPGAAAALPPRLEDTGFEVLEKTPFTPRHALWSDGSAKRRWLHLPRGSAIDTAQPDAWEFPRGTRAWKEFSENGRKVETRYIERLADGSWRYATYVWNREGTQAVLAPAEGLGKIPSRTDCLACHEGAPVPILGYSAVQLEALLPPALGYLHANCGHCHNDTGPLANVELALAQRAAAPAQSAARTRATVLPRAADLLRKMRSSYALTRMPPLGVTIPDAEGIALVARWIQEQEQQPRPSTGASP